MTALPAEEATLVAADEQRRPDPHIAETCSCGASTNVTAPDAREIVREWRETHPHIDGRPDRRTGVGFAATQTTTIPRQPPGHLRHDARA